jgi:hypothetical protein
MTQVLGELPGAGIAIGRGLGHSLQADGFQVAWDRWVDPAGRPRFVVENLFDNRAHGSLVGDLAGQETIEDAAEAVDVGSAINGVAVSSGLLGAHVGGRSQDVSLLSHGGVGIAAQRQAEVHEHGLAQDRLPGVAAVGRRRLSFEDDVGGLYITVDHSHCMGIVQSVGHPRDQLGGLASLDAMGLEMFGQRRAPDEVGDEVGEIIVAADLVHRHDAGVSQLGGGARLAYEALRLLLGGQLAGVGDLDCDQAVQLGVAGQPDGAEGPRAELLEQVELA